MRAIGVVTGSRADYSIYLPVLRRIVADPALRLELYVTGSHLSRNFGTTVNQIRADGFRIAAEVGSLASSNRPQGVSESIAKGAAGFARVLGRRRPDILLVLGDRFEMLAAVVAALAFTIPVAHIAGGEVTVGAVDDSMRHAITKMSHLHFATAEPYRLRIIQMGEEPWRVITTGSPAMDNLKSLKYLTRQELQRVFGLTLSPAPVVVAFHPETLYPTETVSHVRELVAAMASIERPILVSAPNADVGARQVRRVLEAFVAGRADARFVENMGTQRYFSVLRLAGCLVGNSSSGIAEAASFRLPVVNIGDRQLGRISGRNVIHVAAERGAIRDGIETALSPAFRRGLVGLKNPYGNGGAAKKIVHALKTVPLGPELLVKRFHDLYIDGR